MTVDTATAYAETHAQAVQLTEQIVNALHDHLPAPDTGVNWSDVATVNEVRFQLTRTLRF